MPQPLSLSLSETPSSNEQVFPPQKSVSEHVSTLDKLAQQNKKPVTTQPVTTKPLTVQSPKDLKSVTTKPLTVSTVPTESTESTESLNTLFAKMVEFAALQKQLVSVIKANRASSASELAKLESELIKHKNDADKQKSRTMSSEVNDAQTISKMIEIMTDLNKKVVETIQTAPTATATAAAEKYYKYKQKYLQLKNNTL